MFSPDADSSPYHTPSLPTLPDGTLAPTKEVGSVSHSATRLPQSSLPSQSSPSSSVPPSPTRSRIGAAISGTPYPIRTGEETPKVQGFGFVDPLPAHDAHTIGEEGMKELMTWGVLMGTPRIVRDSDSVAGDNESIAGDDDNSGISSISTRMGGHNPFNIAQPSSRDALGRKLGVQASRSLRVQANILSGAGSGLSSNLTPRKRKGDMPPPDFTPRRGVAGTEMLSPAARTLLGRTKAGGVLGLTPRASSVVPSPLGSRERRTGATGRRNGHGRGGGLDLGKVGWSPAGTPVRRSGGGGSSGTGSGRREDRR